MIEIADNEIIYKECLDFIKNKGNIVLQNTVLFYYKPNDKILTVAGLNANLGGTIEPLLSDSIIGTFAMYNYLSGRLKAQGFDYIFLKTVNEKLINIITTKLNFKKYNETNNEFYKEI